MRNTAETDSAGQDGLAQRIARGDRSAESELWRRYARGLRIIVFQRTRDDALAQDIVQDAFRIALGHLRRGRLENLDAVAAFLRGIALNVLSEHRRAAQREVPLDPEVADTLPADAMRGPYDAVSTEERQRIVRRLIQELPVARDRDLLWRYFVLDQDKPQLCHDLELSTEHFDRVLHRAKARFRALMLGAGLSA